MRPGYGAPMRYRWDAGVVTVDEVEVARTGEGFWGLQPRFDLDGDEWVFRNDPEGLIGARDGVDRLGIERGRIWQSTWRMAGLSGPLTLTRTTSWLLGKLHFDLERDGARIGEVLPEGPWRYRPSLELSAAVEPIEAVFVLWCAARIDGRRPAHRISGGPSHAGTSGVG